MAESHVFSGSVTIDGEPCPGSYVEARARDVHRGQATVTAESRYYIFVVQQDGFPVNGEEISFFVDGIFATTAKWFAGGSTGLNLAVSSGAEMAYHYIMLAEQWNEIVWDGPNMDVAEATAGLIDLATVYHYVAATGEWLVYNPTWPAAANTLHTLEYGKTYWVAVDTYPQDWLVPDCQPGQVYTAGAYYAYAPGMEGGYSWRDDWASWIKDMARKETALFAELCGGTINVIFAERWIVPRKMGTGEEIYSYWKAMGIETDLPHGTDVDLPIVFYMDELASGMCCYDNIAVVRATAVQRTIDGRRGDYQYIEDYLPHELGHVFGLVHCSTKPCIMVPGINWESYQQWLDYGEKLYVCDSHRPTLIYNWDSRNIDKYKGLSPVFSEFTIKDYQKG